MSVITQNYALASTHKILLEAIISIKNGNENNTDIKHDIKKHSNKIAEVAKLAKLSGSSGSWEQLAESLTIK